MALLNLCTGGTMPIITMLAALTWLWLQPITTALAQTATPAEFFRGKTVNILVGSQPGGGYDLYARLLAEFLGRHIQGQPTVIVQNMPDLCRYWEALRSR